VNTTQSQIHDHHIIILNNYLRIVLALKCYSSQMLTQSTKHCQLLDTCNHKRIKQINYLQQGLRKYFFELSPIQANWIISCNHKIFWIAAIEKLWFKHHCLDNYSTTRNISIKRAKLRTKLGRKQNWADLTHKNIQGEIES
jgi:hypothetical protein